MPVLQITTNRPIDDSSALAGKASATVSEMLGKPEQYVMINMAHNPCMMFAGSDAPLAYLELKSIGLPEEWTSDLSQKLCELLNAELGIAIERIYIEFADSQRHMFGWNGRTFAG